MSTNDRRPRATQLGALGFAAVALGCAAFAAFLMGRLLTQKGYNRDRVQPVVVAKKMLPAAQPFTEADVQVVNWPEKSVPPGAIGDPKLLFEQGKSPIPTTGILEGEAVVPARLAGAAQGTALAALVKPGHRAVAVKVDESVGRSGLVYPGAFVDVLATVRDPEGRGPSTRIAVQDVRVLAVEAETDVTARRPRKSGESLGAPPVAITGTVVTIEVTPEEAEVVSLVAREGQVDLALRSGSDRERAATKGAMPIQFSAFAPEPASEAAGASPAPGRLDSPAAAAAEARAAQRAGAGRRIEIRATDGRDRASSTSGIETYHAR